MVVRSYSGNLLMGLKWMGSMRYFQAKLSFNIYAVHRNVLPEAADGCK